MIVVRIHKWDGKEMTGELVLFTTRVKEKKKKTAG
jgi:hypothetical protein